MKGILMKPFRASTLSSSGSQSGSCSRASLYWVKLLFRWRISMTASTSTSRTGTNRRASLSLKGITQCQRPYDAAETEDGEHGAADDPREGVVDWTARAMNGRVHVDSTDLGFPFSLRDASTTLLWSWPTPPNPMASSGVAGEAHCLSTLLPCVSHPPCSHGFWKVSVCKVLPR